MEFIKGKIERCLTPSGSKPYSLSTYPFKVKGTDQKFRTLKELTNYFGIKKIFKSGVLWAINSKGKRVEWYEYEAEVPSTLEIK